jgi:septal ring factor EnvC (AmiA/AmiB activator)
MTEPVRLPLAEAARLLGTTADALRKKVKRGHLQAVRDNAGRLLVWVNVPAAGGQVSSLSSHVQAGRLDGLASQESTLVQPLRDHVQPLRDHVETLKAQLARAEAQADAARQRADDLADRLATAERERAADQTARAVVEAVIRRAKLTPMEG